MNAGINIEKNTGVHFGMQEEYGYVMQSERCYLRREKQGDAEFEVTMLLQNPLRELLPCREQQRNGARFLLYDVTSRKTLRDLWEGKALDEDDMRGLLQEVVHILRECDRYLLDRNKIILRSELIFCDLDSVRYFFFYDPYLMSENAENLKGLAEFLVERADYGKESGVEFAYRIYEAVHSPNFTIRTLENCLEYRPAQIETPDKYEAREGTALKPVELPEDGEACDSEEITRDDRRTNLGRALFTKLILGISVLVLGLVVFFYLQFELAWREQVLLAGAGVAGLAAAFICIVELFRRRRSAGIESAADELEEDAGAMVAENVSDKTVFLRPEEYMSGRGLQGMGAQKDLWIPLERLPCTIGRKSDLVDYQLTEETISRIHARFSKEGTHIYLTDLHSTNGTYINGIRLEPERQVALRVGDQIAFGKMNFTYC